MATTRKSSKLPPSPEAKQNALTVVREHPEPVTASTLTKLLLPPHAVSAKDLEPILEEFVAAGALLRLAPKGGRGKPQYWDRDLSTHWKSTVKESLQTVESPLTPQDLIKKVTLPGKPKAAELVPLLEELIAAGEVFAMPVASAKAKPLYWGRPAVEFARQQLRRNLETKGPQPEATLRKALKVFDDAQFQRAIDAGLAEKELFRHPAAGKVKKELLGTRPASPEPYLSDVAAQLAKIVPQLLAANIARDDLRRHLVQVIEAAGIPFAATVGSAQIPRTEAPSAGVDLITLIRRLEPGADRGALVGARDLRRAAQLEKTVFDNAVLDLARQGRLSLHRHDYPSSLSQMERDDLITDGNGTFFIGVALRQSHG
jgi:hypothetical protein